MNEFYKYTTIDTAKIILENNTLRWSNPEIFNDLLELKNIPNFEPSLAKSNKKYNEFLLNKAFLNKYYYLDNKSNEYTDMTKRLFWMYRFTKNEIELRNQLINNNEGDDKKKEKEQIEFIKKHLEKINKTSLRVLCLNKEPLNDVMWGTYCDNHYGCVLEFQPQRKDSFFNAAKKVTYSNDTIIGDGFEYLLKGDKSLKRSVLDTWLFSKIKKWEYEKEWRLFKTINSISNIDYFGKTDYGNYSDLSFDKEDLKSITFGQRTTEKDRDSIRLIVKNKYKNCIFYEIYLGYTNDMIPTMKRRVIK